MNNRFHLHALTQRQFFQTALLCVALACASLSAWAHGGEDHGADAPPPVGSSVAPRAYAQTEDFELVAQLQGTTLTLTLDQFATNAPVADAQIEVESGTTLKAQAQQIAPGVYTVRADALATPGKYPLSFSVQAGDTADLLATTLDTTAPVQAPAHVHGWSERVTWALAAVVLVAGLGLVALRRRIWARKHRH